MPKHVRFFALCVKAQHYARHEAEMARLLGRQFTPYKPELA